MKKPANLVPGKRWLRCDRTTYFPDDQVTGRVKFKLNSTFTCIRMDIMVTGVKFETPTDRRTNQKLPSNPPETLLELLIYRKSNEGEVFNRGKYCFPFQFELPSDIDPSEATANRHVEYAIHVITTSSTNRKIASKPFEVGDPQFPALRSNGRSNVFGEDDFYLNIHKELTEDESCQEGHPVEERENVQNWKVGSINKCNQKKRGTKERRETEYRMREARFEHENASFEHQDARNTFQNIWKTRETIQMIPRSENAPTPSESIQNTHQNNQNTPNIQQNEEKKVWNNQIHWKYEPSK